MLALRTCLVELGRIVVRDEGGGEHGDEHEDHGPHKRGARARRQLRAEVRGDGLGELRRMYNFIYVHVDR